jgi:hypothetical protein
MEMSRTHSHARGQSSLEYLLLLMVVAVVVIAGFRAGSVVDKVHDTAQGYYNTVTGILMGSGNESTTGRQVLPINGGWCPVTCQPSGSFGPAIIYGACECPAPAFGGLPCPAGQVMCNGSYLAGVVGSSGSVVTNQPCAGQKIICQGVTACGPCPTGQQCLAPDGHCGCANGLVCGGGLGGGPTGSVPINCQSCGCPTGTIYNKVTNNCDSCTATASGQCTTTSADGTQCVPIASTPTGCPNNMNCDTSTNSCQCNAGAYWDKSANGGSGGCVYCPQCQSYNTTLKKCVDDANICPASGNWSCSPTAPSAQECQCWVGYKINATGTGCVRCTYTCTATAQCGNSTAGVDDCGNACTATAPGACQPGLTCELGKCVCTTAGVCPTGFCAGNDTCGNPGCSGSCTSPAECSPNTSRCCTPTPNVCTPVYQCGSTQGVDSCGVYCSAAPTCPPSTNPQATECNLSTNTCCVPQCNGKICGAPDGCGGTCQGCPSGKTCVDYNGVYTCCAQCTASVAVNGVQKTFNGAVAGVANIEAGCGQKCTCPAGTTLDYSDSENSGVGGCRTETSSGCDDATQSCSTYRSPCSSCYGGHTITAICNINNYSSSCLASCPQVTCQ